MSEIKVQCIDQAISFLNTPVISSGNVNYDRIVFDFCSRWDGYAKTAIFYRNKDEVYYQLLTNDSCLIPNEVLGEKGVIYIGVFGTLGDKTITSQVLTYRIQEGAITEDLIPADPTPDIYAQIISKYNDYDTRLAHFENRFNGSVGDAEKLGGQLPEYYATAESVSNIQTAIGARNILPYPYFNKTTTWKGIDWTDNGDGTISASGTATETSAFYFVSTGERKMLANIGDTLTISGGHSSNARIMVRCLDSNGTQLSAINAMGESASGVIPENTAYMDAYIRIASGTKVENLTFRPMFELGNVAHDFVPYHFGGAKDASTLERHTAKEIGESGARNLIPYPYQETTHTDNGISWVDNGDGTITASGTATADSYYYLPVGGQFYLNAGTYSISGCPSGGSSTKYRVQLSNNAWTISATDYGNGGTITTTERVNFAQLRLTISKGVTVNNLVFKPMLVLGSVPMPYSPYYVGGAEDSLKLGGLLPSEFVGALPHTNNINFIICQVDLVEVVNGRFLNSNR